MTADGLLQLAGRLGTQAEALAALGALLRIRGEGLTADPDVEQCLEDVCALLGVDLAGIDESGLAIAAGMTRFLLHQAVDLVDDPARTPGWAKDDPVLLQGAGAMSAAIPAFIQQVVPTLDGLPERLTRPGACFVDVGSGVARMSIAACRVWPRAGVIAVEPWEPALRLARRNIAEAGLEDRISLLEQAAEELELDGEADLVWLPGPFLREGSVGALTAAAFRALRPGGWVVFGLFGSPPDPLAVALTELRTVRAGGATTDGAGAAARLERAGFDDVHVAEQIPNAPVLVFGRKP